MAAVSASAQTDTTVTARNAAAVAEDAASTAPQLSEPAGVPAVAGDAASSGTSVSTASETSATEAASQPTSGSVAGSQVASASDAQTTRTMFETTSTEEVMPGWAHVHIGKEWAQRFDATGLYPENFLKVPGGESTEAERTHQEALQHYFMGSYYLELDNAGRAQEEFQAALKLEPGTTGIELGLVRAKIAARELDDAQAHLDQILTGRRAGNGGANAESTDADGAGRRRNQQRAQTAAGPGRGYL